MSGWFDSTSSEEKPHVLFSGAKQTWGCLHKCPQVRPAQQLAEASPGGQCCFCTTGWTSRKHPPECLPIAFQLRLLWHQLAQWTPVPGRPPTAAVLWWWRCYCPLTLPMEALCSGLAHPLKFGPPPAKKADIMGDAMPLGAPWSCRLGRCPLGASPCFEQPWTLL